MGMFDTIYFYCPACYKEIEFQSKSGDCTLERYHHTDVPADVAEDRNRHSPQKCCGKSYELGPCITMTRPDYIYTPIKELKND